MGELRALMEHLRELRRRLVIIFATLGVLFVIVLFVSVEQAEVAGIPVVYPTFDYGRSLTILVYDRLVEEFKPDNVTLMPYQATGGIFLVMKMALYLAVILALPVILYEFAAFIAPGLYGREKRLIRRYLVPATVLFIAGAIFCYLIVLPWTFGFLAYFADLIIRTPDPTQTILWDAGNFVSLILLFILALGFAFELPIIMIGATRIGFVSRKFWADNWRYAVIVILIFGAVVTPDGSGVTMFFVAIPMWALYAAGWWFAKDPTDPFERAQAEAAGARTRARLQPLWEGMLDRLFGLFRR